MRESGGVLIYIKYFSPPLPCCPQISRPEPDCGECQVNYVVTTQPPSAEPGMLQSAIIQTLRLKHGRVVIDVLNEDCDRQVGGGAVPPVTRQTEPETNN